MRSFANKNALAENCSLHSVVKLPSTIIPGQISVLFYSENLVLPKMKNNFFYTKSCPNRFSSWSIFLILLSAMIFTTKICFATLVRAAASGLNGILYCFIIGVLAHQNLHVDCSLKGTLTNELFILHSESIICCIRYSRRDWCRMCTVLYITVLFTVYRYSIWQHTA